MIKFVYSNINRLIEDRTKTGLVIFCGVKFPQKFFSIHPEAYTKVSITRLMWEPLHKFLPVLWRSENREFYTRQFAGSILRLRLHSYHNNELIYEAYCENLPSPKKPHYEAYEAWADEILMARGSELNRVRCGREWIYLLTNKGDCYQDINLNVQTISAPDWTILQEEVVKAADSRAHRALLYRYLNPPVAPSADSDLKSVILANGIVKGEELAMKLASFKNENEALLFLHSHQIKDWNKELKETYQHA